MLITAVYTLGFLMTQAMGAGLLLQALSGFDYHVGMVVVIGVATCLLYTSPSPRDYAASRMPSSA